MDYADYFADHTYEELPEAVRVTVSRADYAAQRAVANELREPPEELPARLQLAFAAATAPGEEQGARPREAKAVGKSRAGYLPWLAAAGWLLFAVVGLAYLWQPTEPLLVEKTIMAPAAAPVTIYLTDTLYLTTDRWRTRTVYDTLYRVQPAEPRLVRVTDTVYLPAPEPVLVAGGSSLAGKERVLEFLFSTE